MIKKITLLAMAIAALVAFAAPSMASAAEWKTSETPVGGLEEADAVHLTGTLTSTKGPLKISCNATSNVSVWNEGAGVGSVESLTLTADPVGTAGCTVGVLVAPNTYVDVTGCHVTPSTEAFPWAVTTAGANVTIHGANFTNEFNGCAGSLGIPNGTSIKAEGNVVGVAEGNCINFNQAGEIAEVKIDGGLCATSGALELN